MKLSFFNLGRSYALHLPLAIMVACAAHRTARCAEIHDAANKGDLEKIRTLLSGDPNLVSSKDTNGLTPVFYAARAGHSDAVQLLLSNKAAISIFDAAAVGDLNKIKYALKTAPDTVSAKDNNGRTLLHFAALCDQDDVAKFLLLNKANVDAKDNEGNTPLHDAAAWFHKRVLELLLNNKADANASNGSGSTPLHQAAGGGPDPSQADIISLLLAKGANVDAMDGNHNSPLSLCVAFGTTDAAKVLLEHKADSDGPKGSGWTPLAIAQATGKKEMAELLRSYRASAYFNR